MLKQHKQSKCCQSLQAMLISQPTTNRQQSETNNCNAKHLRLRFEFQNTLETQILTKTTHTENSSGTKIVFGIF